VGDSGTDGEGADTAATPAPPTAAPPPPAPLGVNDILRFLLQLFALLSLAFWGYMAWPFPWPAFAYIVGAPAFAALVWWLFRSAKAPLPLDPVGKALIEILIMGSVVVAWLMLDYPIVAAVFGVIAAVSGIIHGRAEISREPRP